MASELHNARVLLVQGRIDMAKTVAELLVDVLAEAGVERVYGVPGDSLNGITDSIRVRQNISWVGVNAEQFDSWVRPEEMTHPLRGKQ
jgi:hypothetical protein